MPPVKPIGNQVLPTLQAGAKQFSYDVSSNPQNIFGSARAAGNQLAGEVRRPLSAVMGAAQSDTTRNLLTAPVSTIGTPMLEKAGMPAGAALALGTIGDFALPNARVGQAMKIAKVSELLKARNLLTEATEKPGSVMFHMNRMANGSYTPIKVRQAPEGLVIEDGRHRLEAAKQLGLKDLMVEDVSKFYKPQPRDTVGRYTIK